jgi:hypothetical protein
MKNFDKKRLPYGNSNFGSLYIGKHPTPRRNSYTVMQFDFSGLNTISPEKFTVQAQGNFRAVGKVPAVSIACYAHRCKVSPL